MNNTVLKIIAGVLLLGAIAVAYIGIQLSREPAQAPVPVAAPASPASVPTEAVVVAARVIKKGQSLNAADAIIKSVTTAPQAVYRDTQDVFGKVALEDIPPGTPLTPALFATDSMASLLLVGERAIAVQVDEVIGVGGYAKPGDRVDVLVYLPPGKETRQQTIAKVIIRDAGVLAFGDANRIDDDQHKRTQKEVNPADARSGSVADEVKNRRQGLRSAVLAVREEEVTRLILASGAGQLRLALRPQVTRRTDAAGIHERNGGATTTVSSDPGTRTLTMSDSAGGGAIPSSIVIQEGSKERALEATKTENQP